MQNQTIVFLLMHRKRYPQANTYDLSSVGRDFKKRWGNNEVVCIRGDVLAMRLRPRLRRRLYRQRGVLQIYATFL